MQSSMWKLLTAAGIIGIGTLVVLEVQSRLPMPSSAAEAGSSTVAVPPAGTDVTPDATADFDRMLAGSEAFQDTQFSLDEPNAPQDTGAPVPPEDDQSFVGVTPVSRTVLKDSLADEENPFDRSPEPGNGPHSTEKTAAVDTLAPAPASATVPPAGFSSESLPESSSDSSRTAQPASTSSTKFFNGNQGIAPSDTPLKSAAAPVATPEPGNHVTPASAQAFSDGRTTAPSKTAVRAAASTSQDETDVPDFFMPDTVPEIGSPAEPATPRLNSDADVPLMETPGFEDDSVPDPGLTTEPANPAAPVLDSVPSDRSSIIPGETPTPVLSEPNTRFFEADEPVPTPPADHEGSTPDPRPEAPSAFELDPVPEPDQPRMPPSTTRGPAPRPAPQEPLEADFPAPSYPDQGSVPGLNEKAPFDSLPKPRVESDDSSNLPAISDRPSRSTPDRSSHTSGDAADRNMSEVMRPQLSIQKRAPNTATVGVAHEYTIIVSNEGDSTAYDVIVDDELGNGATLENSKPTAEFDRVTGKLSWTIRELAPRDKQEIVVRIKPTGEGTLDGIATVRFKAQVKSATIITAPKLTLEMTSPNEVKVGDEVQLRYVISNNGSGDAGNVILRSVLPPGLKHSEGGDLEYEIENLRAGDSEEINLAVVAAEPGRFRTISEVTTSGISADKATTEIDIVGSQLTIQRLGPERRFVGRTAKFQNIVSNDTNFEANNAIVTEQVPEGMRFISADNGGEYNPQTSRVRWEIARLAPGKQTVLEVELEAESAGQRQTVVEVVESAGFRSQATENTVVTVEDYENMTADISRQDAPVAIGETFGFTITIENRGTAVARNVEMVIEVPEQITVKAAGTRNIPARRAGNSVRYAIVDAIQPSEKMTFELKLQGEQPARNALVQASLKYEQMKEPLIVSESVTIFDDRP